MEGKRTAIPVAAGVLILISEGFKLLGFLGLFIAGLFIIVPTAFPFSLTVFGLFLVIPYLVLAAIAVYGGIAAIQRTSWGWALAGAIISAFPFSLLGIVAVILVALSKDEFG